MGKQIGKVPQQQRAAFGDPIDSARSEEHGGEAFKRDERDLGK
jgi:hypothetical protein